jgi:hypothetical protein
MAIRPAGLRDTGTPKGRYFEIACPGSLTWSGGVLGLSWSPIKFLGLPS